MMKPVKITSKMNGKSLTVSQGQFKTKPGYLISTKYYGGMKQQFYVIPTKQDFIVRSLFNNNVFDVEGGSSNTYSPILTYKHHGNPNQLWRLKKLEGVENAFYIQNRKSEKVLEIEGGIDAEGMRIVQNQPYKNLNQLWTVEQI